MSGPPEHHDSSGIRAGRAVLLVVVGVICAVLLLGRLGQHTGASATASSTGGGRTSAPTTAAPPAATTTTVPGPAVPTSQVHVQVLNGVLTGSLSSQWSTKLSSAYGYQTEPPDNASSAVDSSTIYVLTTGYLPEAQRLAAEVGLPDSAIVASSPPPADAPIPASVLALKPDLVLVIGPDLASQA